MIAMSVEASKPVGAAGGRLVGAGRAHRIVDGVRYVILAAAGLGLMLTGCTVSATGRPVAAPDLGHWQPPPILNARLGNLLLSASDVDAVGQTTNMALRRPISRCRTARTSFPIGIAWMPFHRSRLPSTETAAGSRCKGSSSITPTRRTSASTPYFRPWSGSATPT